jgi:hypothetical protein
MWDVRYTDAASQELTGLPDAEKAAVLNAVEKLRAFGPSLPFPHQSAVRGAVGIRELRPRQGRSPWRAFYCRSSDVFVIAAIGPEAQVNSRGFARAIAAAQQRCAEIEITEEDDNEAIQPDIG